MSEQLHPKFAKLRSYLPPGSRGIEIAPWTRPIAPKRDGFRTIIVDLFDQDALRARCIEAHRTQDAIDRIEPVDVVGDASNLHDLIRSHGYHESVDWVVSSHNFEHLANPLGFLQDVERLLVPGGILAMLIPDKRFMFDRFKPHSTAALMVQAATQPPAQDRDHWAEFNQRALGAQIHAPPRRPIRSWSPATNRAERLAVLRDPTSAYRELQRNLRTGAPSDFSGHRWYFTPSALRLIMLDLRVLGLIKLRVEALWSNDSCDFAVVLRRDETAAATSSEDSDMKRSELCLAVEDELARVTNAYLNLEAQLRGQGRGLAELKRRLETSLLSRSARGMARRAFAELRRRVVGRRS